MCFASFLYTVENQLLCCGLFPVAISIVKSRATQQLKRPAVIFLGVCVSGNGKLFCKLVVLNCSLTTAVLLNINSKQLKRSPTDKN